MDKDAVCENCGTLIDPPKGDDAVFVVNVVSEDADVDFNFCSSDCFSEWVDENYE